MTAKRYLQEIYRLNIKIKQRTEQLNELKASASGFRAIDYSADKIQATPSDRMANVIGRCVDLEESVNKLVEEYLYKKNYIINQIQGLDDIRYIKILYDHYVDFKSLDTISKEIPYDYNWLCHLHGLALKSFADKYLN